MHSLLAIVAEAVSLVRNDQQSTGVAKGRALAYIATIVARMLPLVEAADAQVEDWDRIRREQEVAQDFVLKSGQDRQTISDSIDLGVRIKKEAARRHACEVINNGEPYLAPQRTGAHISTL